MLTFVLTTLRAGPLPKPGLTETASKNTQSSNIEDTDMSELENWTPAQVKKALDNGEIVLIDVRTPQEYMIEHVEGSLLMPMAFFNTSTLPTQDGKRIVLHCGSGIRSGKVSEKLAAAGITPLAHMEGGFGAWKEAGLPYIGTDMATGAPTRMQKEPTTGS